MSDEKKQEQALTPGSLFNNPMVLAAKKNMSKEEREYFEKLGEALHGSVDFENNSVANSLPPAMANGLAYVEQGIKSGLLPVDLEKNEVQLLHEVRGEKWWEYYGFTDKDMKGVTLWKAGD